MKNCYSVGSRKARFHRYRRFPQPTLASSLSLDMERGMGLDFLLNQAIATNEKHSQCTIQEQDQFMPIENVVRVMRKILPPHAKISDEFKVTIQKSVSEFIGFITGKANDYCQHEQRNSIAAEDVLWALNSFGFDDYIEPLTLYLQGFREDDGGAGGSLKGEPLLLKHSMVDPSSGCSITQGDASDGNTSQCTVSTVDNEVDSPANEGKD